jgi:hypothetical protein
MPERSKIMMVPEELEEEEEGSPQNRLFVILAIALIGLLVLGLLGIGGVFVVRQNMREQAAAARPTPTLLVRLPNPTATFTPTPLPTNTLVPTPTNTPVVAPGGVRGQEAASKQGDTTGEKPDEKADQPGEATKITLFTPKTPAPNTAPAGGGTVPETGVGGMGAALIGAGLAAVFFVARRLRTNL